MNKKEIILIGGGGHCKSCIDVIESTNEYSIAGIIDDKSKIGKKVLGYPIIGCDDDLISLNRKYKFALITVGQIKSNKARVNIFKKLKEANYTLPIIIANTAIVSKHATIKEGTIIMHQTIVNANANIGHNCIINSKALIEHDVKIGDHCHVATHATINGNVVVNNNCFIGSCSCISNGISINNNTTIGTYTLVNKNINIEGTYIGVPANKVN